MIQVSFDICTCTDRGRYAAGFGWTGFLLFISQVHVSVIIFFYGCNFILGAKCKYFNMHNSLQHMATLWIQLRKSTKSIQIFFTEFYSVMKLALSTLIKDSLNLERNWFVCKNPIQWIEWWNLFSVEIVKNEDETTTKTSTVEVRLKNGLPGD